MMLLIVVAPSSPETLFRCGDLSLILASSKSVILAFCDVNFPLNLVPLLSTFHLPTFTQLG